jgi:hypothetical protein
LGLNAYLQRLKTAPGATIEPKIEFLDYTGVKLSQAGLRDLEAATKRSLEVLRQTANKLANQIDRYETRIDDLRRTVQQPLTKEEN